MNINTQNYLNCENDIDVSPRLLESKASRVGEQNVLSNSNDQGPVRTDSRVKTADDVDEPYPAANATQEKHNKQRQCFDFDKFENILDLLIESTYLTRRELFRLKENIGEYKTQFNKHRLNSKTKELESIMLINENARLREEIEELRKTTNGAPTLLHTGYNKDDTDTNCRSRQSFNAYYSEDIKNNRSAKNNSDKINLNLNGNRHLSLTPLCKPRIYRRYQTSDNLTGNDVKLSCLQNETGNDKMIPSRVCSSLETTTMNHLAIADRSMSVPNVTTYCRHGSYN